MKLLVLGLMVLLSLRLSELYCEAEKRRTDLISEFQNGIAFVRKAVLYTSCSLKEAAEGIDGKSAREFFSHAAKGLAAESQLPVELPDEAAEEIRAFALLLVSAANRESLKKETEQIQDALQKRYEREKAEMAKKCRIARSLGFAGSLMLVVLLI